MSRPDWSNLRVGGTRVRQLAHTWLRERRRAMVAKRRARNRRTYALLGTLGILAGVLIWSFAYGAPAPHGAHLRIDQLSKLATEGRVVDASFHDQDSQIVGHFTCSATAAPTCGASNAKPTAEFWVSYPKSNVVTPLLLQALSDSGAHISVDPQTRKSEVSFFSSYILPLMILANLFVLFFTSGKGSGSGIGEVELFGSIGKGRFGRRKKTPITFADVAGADEALAELKEVRDYLADPERYRLLGAAPPKGVLLIGPPGCGKTLLAKAVAGEVGVPFFSVAGAEFVESLVGVGAARVRDLFRRVRAVAPAVVFIDELDAAGRKRATGGGAGGNEEREQTLNQILVEMDGFDAASGVVIIGATNRPDILDPALLRPGRFDRHVTVDRPDLAGRAKILELHAHGKQFTHDVDFGQVARRTPGFSGADLANVVNEAALLAIRQAKVEIGSAEVDEAIQRSLVGTVRKGRVLTPEERKRAAYHESGHIVIAAAAGRTSDIHRVSILAQGHNIGTTAFRSDSEALMLTKTQLYDKLMVHMGGVAAEELVFGEASTGSEDDMRQASDLVRDIVARFGLSDLGRLRLLAPDVDGFLDADVPLAALSGATHQEMDAEMRRLLADAERDATEVLIRQRATLELIATQLEQEETLEGADLELLLATGNADVELFGEAMPTKTRRNRARVTAGVS
jgi:cell division protease FtsH